MEPVKFTPLELEALLIFLKENARNINLPSDGAMCRYLYLAFIKLLKAKEQWEDAMKYTE